MIALLCIPKRVPTPGVLSVPKWWAEEAGWVHGQVLDGPDGLAGVRIEVQDR